MIASLPKIIAKPLTRISPSRFLSLKNCPLRELLTANGKRDPLLPGSPSAKIGTLIHNLIEDTSKGFIRNEEEMLEKWEMKISEIEHTMRKSSLENRFIPLRIHAHNYDVKKESCFALIRNLIGFKQYSGKALGLTKSEVWVESPDKQVGGFIDLVRQSSSGIHIVDFKSGTVFDEQWGIVKLEYVLQLRMYAALYYKKFKVWPARASVIGLDCYEKDVDFIPDECILLIEQAISLLRDINEKLLLGQNQALANPTPNSCRYCGFRPACDKYWETKSEHPLWPIDVRGFISEIKPSNNGKLTLKIRDMDSFFTIRGLDNTIDDIPKIGAKFSIYNLGRDTVPGCFYATNYTVGYGHN
ncbi:MAG: PD-(D/E)XK nuclease family protein [Pelosinus sp.]|nr:PD-(D/E)XK nuclease family protein [Pelosinus sp.]